jgi:hypothetical protein
MLEPDSALATPHAPMPSAKRVSAEVASGSLGPAQTAVVLTAAGS